MSFVFGLVEVRKFVFRSFRLKVFFVKFWEFLLSLYLFVLIFVCCILVIKCLLLVFMLILEVGVCLNCFLKIVWI